jgi:hypothetical protein
MSTPKPAPSPRADPVRRLLRFPLRQIPAVLVVPARGGGGWLALAGSHGWLFGSRAAAEARWLGRNLGLPVREIAA